MVSLTPGHVPQSAGRGTLADLAPFALFSVLGFALLTLSRLALLIWQQHTVAGMPEGLLLMGNGVRVDVATLCLLYGLPAVMTMLLPSRGLAALSWRRMLRFWFALTFGLLVFMEAATPAFMDEYGLRPNRLFLEYLLYPREVASTVLKGHTISAATAVIVTAFATWAAWKLATRSLPGKLRIGARYSAWRPLLACALLLLAGLGVRSSLGHRPLNPAMVATTADPTLNVMPLNSLYSVAHAGWQLLGAHETSRLYGDMPQAEIIAQVRQSSGLSAEAYVSEQLPTLALRPAAWQGKPRNLVIVLVESLGAQFIGSLQGMPLSPEFDRLSLKGWSFQHLYATGTRSVRGIEAVVSGFTPTPNQAVLKLPPGRQGFYTLAETLRRRGYDTGFYYGGEAHFDNMKQFFLDNGFQHVIEEKDYVHPKFRGSWGVSDEDLLERADAEFTRLHAQQKPFFGLVFTSSNHDPFEFPDGRIDLFEQPKQTRNNAAKYADYALGLFFEQAQRSPYWEDTVFLVVADHDSRVFGKALVPIGNFHIPGLILGGGIAPYRDDRLVSQVDLGPTLLSLLGINDATPMIGRDLTASGQPVPGRAMMQYEQNFAWLEGNDGVILQPDKPAQCFSYDFGKDDMSLQPQCGQPELVRRALAHALWGTVAYEQDLYRLPRASK